MKQYLVTASLMKQYDTNTIEKFKVPSLLLMERAALGTVGALQKEMGNAPCRVLVVAGGGNNGGDGLAVGRLLMLQGYEVDFVLLSKRDKCSKETRRQVEILQAYQARFYDRIEENEYHIVIDAIFGIGLSREVEGGCREAVERINRIKAYVVSVDIPSGINADDGSVMGCAVRADLTVTYGFCKIGQLLYPAAEYVGKLVCCDIGIEEHSFLGDFPVWHTYHGADGLPTVRRRREGNKGTFGKVLVIAGSSQIYGAAYLAAKSCFRAGAGMVKILTAIENRESLQRSIPEAMLSVYREPVIEKEIPDVPKVTEEQGTAERQLEDSLKWADFILIGPGIGTGALAAKMLNDCITRSSLPMVIDADGINLLAMDKELQALLKEEGEGGRQIILTPHLGEFARLYGCQIKEAKAHITKYPKQLADRLCSVVVCKDARTVVAGSGRREQYLNCTGNAGMATAGSGDVLAGMIAGLAAQGLDSMDAAVTGVCLHGMAGDLAAAEKTGPAMMAADIMEKIPEAQMSLDC